MVVGAGLAGLSWRDKLAASGMDVTVVEAPNGIDIPNGKLLT